MTTMIVLLFLITSLSRLATSLYLPALPVIGKDLHVEETILGLSLTVYFSGFAFFTLFVGPMSDALGRRRVLLVGSLVFLLGSGLCGLAQGGYSLLFGRLLQAAGSCAIPVTSRAVIRDAFNDEEVITVVGWMGAMGAFVPAFAPTLGGAITEFAGWRYTFLFLAVTSFLVLIISFKKLPETLPAEKRHPLKLSHSFKAFRTMLTSSRFMFALLPIFFCFAIQGIYFTCAPFIFIREMHLTPTQFGMTNLVLVAALVLGRFLCPFLARRTSHKNVYTISGGISFLGGIGFFALFYIESPDMWIVLIPASLFCLAFGTMVPIGLKEALTAFKHQSGTASALYGCLTLGASGISSALAGVGMDMEFSALHVMAAISSSCCLIIFLTTIFSRSKIPQTSTIPSNTDSSCA